jgi:sigma-B regulation protein RsbU (phosphoserine phosphatase)
MAIFKHTDERLFATALYLVADVRTGEILYANAGHPSPLQVSARTGEVGRIPCGEGQRGPALGLISETEYPTCHWSLDLNDLFVLFTDGICEVERADRTVFGEDRLVEVVQRYREKPPRELFRRVVREASAFSEGRGFPDDVCLLGMEVARLG